MGCPEGLTINEGCNSMIILWAVSKLKVTTCCKNGLIICLNETVILSKITEQILHLILAIQPRRKCISSFQPE